MVALLDILLAEAATRKAMERGFGLCARHALPALAMLSRDSRLFLAGALRVKFEIMRWELNETLRKSAWSSRPEQDGDDPTAWRRAIRLISGHMT